METWQRYLKFALLVVAFLAVWLASQSYGQTQTPAPNNARLLAPDQFVGDKFTKRSGKQTGQKTDFLAADPSGWVDLMPDESFQGWTRVAIPPSKPLDPVSQWKLEKESGYILCEGDHGHEWLRYDHELTNFLLHVEWRFEKREGLTGYNSGVFVRNDLDGTVWHQAQVSAEAYIFGQTLIHGEVSPMITNPPPVVNPLHPIGEWNTYEIRCDGPKITLWVNGDLTSEFTAAEARKGYTGLEAEGYRIEFRNIKLKTLP